jgi:uncharacterized protein (DUF2147 family)
MKRVWILFMVALALIVPAGFAQAQGGNADAVLGEWLTEGGKSAVQIYKCDDKYCGKIIWLKEPKHKDGSEKLDDKNPDPNLQKRPLLGMDLVWGFVYDGEKWLDGGIYDPESGKTYYCKMTLVDNDTLKVRGSLGSVGLLGRTTTWTRKK